MWSLAGDPLADASWHLRPYQRGEPRFYVEHIRRAVEITASDPGAWLIFSGGETAREAGPVSEARGYLRLAEHFAWWGHAAAGDRSATEEFALDSFQNVLFSICRFRECAGAYPQRVTVAGWRFKARRFDCHRAALGIPAERFQYVGVNDPEDVAAARRGEEQTCAAFARDPYGWAGDLAAKRRERNPFDRQPGYAVTCPELRALLDHRGPERFAGPLPWR